MEGTRLRGAGRLCRERAKSFLAPREGNALSNLSKKKISRPDYHASGSPYFQAVGVERRGDSRADPEVNALPNCAVVSRRVASDKAPAF